MPSQGSNRVIAAAWIVSLLVVSCGGGIATDPTTTRQAEVSDTVSPTSGDPVPATITTLASTSTTSAAVAADTFAGVVDIGGRGLYLRCAGSGSPTVIMEGGDEDTSQLVCLRRGVYRSRDQNLRLRPGQFGPERSC